jgi:hypothetical protein
MDMTTLVTGASGLPTASRSPVDTSSAAWDFGFRAKIDRREGIRLMIELAAKRRAERLP